MIEEILKGFAVLLVFLARHEFDSILDGMVYAGITALGFAATENAYYIYTYGYQKRLGRVVQPRLCARHPGRLAASRLHCLFGIGLAIARINTQLAGQDRRPAGRPGRWPFSLMPCTTPSPPWPPARACLLGFFFDWSGWFLLFLFGLAMILREKMWLSEFLKDEITLGTLTPRQYETACSSTKSYLAELTALGSPNFRATRRFYQVCAELAHKKRQLTRLGEEGGNSAIIERLRAELASLSPHAAA